MSEDANIPAGNSPSQAEDLEDLFENAPCGYVSTDPAGRIQKANATFAAWTGYDSASLVGKRFQDLLNIAGRIYYETHFAPLLRMQGFFNEVALDVVCADKQTLPVLVNAVEKRQPNGDPIFVRITIFNATDRRRFERELLAARAAADAASRSYQELNASLEAKIAEAVAERAKVEDVLRQSQKMEALGQLTGGIAHDFNNMLAVVISGINLAERRLARGEDAGKYLAGAMDGAKRATSLTNRLLAFSRQMPLKPEAVDANRLVSSMSEILHRALGEDTPLETVLAGGLWKIHVDSGQLENVLLNLAINARDAMPGGGKLTIETANCHLDDAYARAHAVVPGQYVLIAVSDTGTGMSAEVIEKAFEPFFSTKEVGKGTGLGLSQVHGFVKQSNGHVKIYSELGQGTTVKIYLPRLYGDGQQRADEEEHRPLPRGSTSEVILVVEDDMRMREMTVAALRELGFGVLHAESAAAALSLLTKHPEIALLFSDVVMPEMNGRRLAEEASKLRPDLKVIFTTGYARNAVVHNGVADAGANFLAKPFTLDQLADKIHKVLSSSK